jgi:hypothetical protein
VRGDRGSPTGLRPASARAGAGRQGRRRASGFGRLELGGAPSLDVPLKIAPDPVILADFAIVDIALEAGDKNVSVPKIDAESSMHILLEREDGTAKSSESRAIFEGSMDDVRD